MGVGGGPTCVYFCLRACACVTLGKGSLLMCGAVSKGCVGYFISVDYVGIFSCFVGSGYCDRYVGGTSVDGRL